MSEHEHEVEAPNAGTVEQPMSKPNDSTPIWDLVRADIAERDKLGRERYGTPLQAFNGRDALVDAYQEALDLVVYMRQEIEERAARKRRLIASFQTDTLQPVEPPESLPPVPGGTLRVGMGDLMDILTSRAQAQRQVTELQEDNTRLVEERRLSIHARVREFFTVAEQHIPEKIGIPSDDIVRFRVRLVVEETLELVKSSIRLDGWYAPSSRRHPTPSSMSPEETLTWLHDALMQLILDADIMVDLPEFADACADIDYVVEGARIAFGIDGEPIMKLVQAANLAKAGGPIRESDGKRLKPDGWLPPDVEGALIAQGWRR